LRAYKLKLSKREYHWLLFCLNKGLTALDLEGQKKELRELSVKIWRTVEGQKKRGTAC
jgi:hypothetical protein